MKIRKGDNENESRWMERVKVTRGEDVNQSARDERASELESLHEERKKTRELFEWGLVTKNKVYRENMTHCALKIAIP